MRARAPSAQGPEYLAGAMGLDRRLRAVGAGGDQEEGTVEVMQGLRRKGRWRV